jgi:hypothetical protein
MLTYQMVYALSASLVVETLSRNRAAGDASRRVTRLKHN